MKLDLNSIIIFIYYLYRNCNVLFNVNLILYRFYNVNIIIISYNYIFLSNNIYVVYIIQVIVISYSSVIKKLFNDHKEKRLVKM